MVKYPLTYQIFPLGKKKLLLRLINLSDKFDKKAKAQFIDITKLALSLYRSSNPSSTKTVIPIVSETSITHNQAQSEIKRFEWVGNDDEKLKIYKPTKDTKDKIALDPQVIRTFEIDY